MSNQVFLVRVFDHHLDWDDDDLRGVFSSRELAMAYAAKIDRISGFYTEIDTLTIDALNEFQPRPVYRCDAVYTQNTEGSPRFTDSMWYSLPKDPIITFKPTVHYTHIEPFSSHEYLTPDYVSAQSYQSADEARKILKQTIAKLKEQQSSGMTPFEIETYWRQS
jgi:hypothetical protein